MTNPYRVHQVFVPSQPGVTEHQFLAAPVVIASRPARSVGETVSSSQMGTNLLSYIPAKWSVSPGIGQIQQQLKQHFGLSFSRRHQRGARASQCSY